MVLCPVYCMITLLNGALNTRSYDDHFSDELDPVESVTRHFLFRPLACPVPESCFALSSEVNPVSYPNLGPVVPLLHAAFCSLFSDDLHCFFLLLWTGKGPQIDGR